ncbi:Arylsulfatase [Roseimaritima multifibrata]|uniref:Arylsulfatase n=1 Tax=Roseimaritima multifibrata TaxID=1930274 RepID=A0A517MHE2_9BACT|nr:sulfatase-like hydrolase/transferase [Roseimaritima multifibrata]QDS94197.1 Arylsulfatase [Roseimaritima multifibrata]
MFPFDFAALLGRCCVGVFCLLARWTSVVVPVSVVVAVPLVGVSRLVAEEVSPPNVILIMADDIGRECFGCYGSEQYRTPNIDRLAKEGMRFEHCYSQPLCTPSRVKIMTGLSNVRNYSGFSILNRDQKTIGHHMQEAGYRTLVAGKWQLLGANHYSKQFQLKGTWPAEAGFDRFCLWQVDQLGDRYWQPTLNVDGKTITYGKDDYGPDKATDFIVDFMESHTKASKQPFFVYYPMILVHNPFEPTPDSESRNAKGKKKNFVDMVAYMDKLVGRIVKKTEALGVADNTVILFTADNGTHTAIQSEYLGKSFRGGKGKTTDAGTREPLVAYWPNKIAANVVNEDLVDFSDFLPTLLDLSGRPQLAGADGYSFWPQLMGEPGKPRQSVYCYYCPRPEKSEPVRFARDQRWKLYGDGRFFDVKNDPKEKTPITDFEGRRAARQAKAKLSAAIQAMPAEGQRLLQFAE